MTQIVADAYEKNCDIAIVVSADSDMIPAVEIAKSIGQRVFVYFPPNHYSNNLALLAMVILSTLLVMKVVSDKVFSLIRSI